MMNVFIIIFFLLTWILFMAIASGSITRGDKVMGVMFVLVVLETITITTIYFFWFTYIF